jgi:chromosome segregation ATPase
MPRKVTSRKVVKKRGSKKIESAATPLPSQKLSLGDDPLSESESESDSDSSRRSTPKKKRTSKKSSDSLFSDDEQSSRRSTPKKKRTSKKSSDSLFSDDEQSSPAHLLSEMGIDLETNDMQEHIDNLERRELESEEKINLMQEHIENIEQLQLKLDGENKGLQGEKQRLKKELKTMKGQLDSHVENNATYKKQLEELENVKKDIKQVRLELVECKKFKAQINSDLSQLVKKYK